MEKIIISKEHLELIDNLTIRLISYPGSSSPYRILSGKNEFVILDSDNYKALHGKVNENKKLVITYMDSSLEVTILEDGILVENSGNE